MRFLIAAILLAALPSEALASAALARSLLGAGRSLAVPVSLQSSVSMKLPILGVSIRPSALTPTLQLPVSMKLFLPASAKTTGFAAAPAVVSQPRSAKVTLEEAAKNLARSPGGAWEQLSFVFDGVPAEIWGTPAGRTRLVRTVIDPEGREVRLVRVGSRYRVTRQGEGKPILEFDIANIEGDGIPAYTVNRKGRGGLWIDGRVLWEDGRYD